MLNGWHLYTAGAAKIDMIHQVVLEEAEVQVIHRPRKKDPPFVFEHECMNS